MAEAAVYEWKKTGKDQFGGLLEDPTKPKAPAADPMASPAQGSPFGTTNAARGAMGEGSFDSLFREGPKPTTPSFGDLLGDVEPQRKQAVQGAYGALGEGFQAPQGPSQESRIQMNEFDKQATAARRAVEEKSALAGRVGTGQMAGDFGQFITQSLLPERADLGAKLSANDQAATEARRQNSFANLLGLEGLGSQESLAEKQIQATKEGQVADIASREKIAFADLSQRDRELAQQAMQFTSRLDFDKWATQSGLDQQTANRIWQSVENEKARTSTEKIAFAELTVREKELAQAGQQFKDELSFKKYATEGGWSQQEADRAWRSIESEKDRALTRSESALGRELQKYITDSGLQMDARKLEENVRQFNSRETFDRWATQAQLDDNSKDRIWKSHESDIARKWETGERMSEQEHEVNLTRLQGDIDTAKMQLQQTLNLDTLEKQQGHEKIMAGIQNTYQTLRDDRLFSHEEAMEATKNEYAKELTAMGFTHEQAMQAAEIAAQAAEGERNRTHETLLAKAELAQKSEFFRQELGLDRARVQLERDKFAQYLTEYGDIKVGKDLDDALNISATISTLAGDDEDAQRFAAQTLFQALGSKKGADGQPLLPPDMVAHGLLSMTAASFSKPEAFTAWASQQKNPDGTPKYTPDQIARVTASAGPGGVGGGKPEDTGYGTSVQVFEDALGDLTTIFKGGGGGLSGWATKRGSDQVMLAGKTAKVTNARTKYDADPNRYGIEMRVEGGKKILYVPETGTFLVLGGKAGKTYKKSKWREYPSAKEALFGAGVGEEEQA
jgi:hypothetical protein